MAVDAGRIEAAVTELLLGIGDDPARPGLADTPRRVAASYAEFFAGLGVDAAALLVGVPSDRTGELVAVRDLAFRSMCEHHLLPFTGMAHIAYEPGERIAGLGDLARALEAVASRPQLQERLGEQLAEAIATGLSARGALVILDAVHACVTTRGPRQTGSSTLTVAAVGSLAEPAARDRALALIGAGA
ncbi:MAG TPA: GTP cyclohydrolase I [Rhodoglobus sp.]|nr:GTP cyclohydrolase I [Rhodoglobus sp.]